VFGFFYFYFLKWDFDFGVTSVTYKSQSSGETYSGTYAVGETISSSSYDAAELTITLSTGAVLQGIISNDRGDQSSTVIKSCRKRERRKKKHTHTQTLE
jgi:hypothetical protein